MLGVSIVMFSLLSLRFINDAIGASLFAALAIGTVIVFPAVIIVTDAGVTAHHWWGRTATIRWRDVKRLEYRRGPSTTIVVAESGVKITQRVFTERQISFEKCASNGVMLQ